MKPIHSLLNNSNMMTLIGYVILFFSLSIINSVQAGSVITTPQNHLSDFTGEYIGIQTRKLALVYQDVVIPGNAGLDIVVTRRQSGDKVNFTPLKLVVSRLYKVNSPIMNTSCLGTFNKLSVMYQGEQLVPAGFSSHTNLPSNMLAAFSNNAYVGCALTDPSIPVLHLANGQKITLRVLRSVNHNSGYYRIYGIDTITDRYQNTIRYDYENDIQAHMPKRIKRITRNDGVVVDFLYGQSDQYFSYVKTIQYLQAKIHYQYTNRRLTAVIDQADRTTTFEYATYTGIGAQVHKITMPSGMQVKYSHGAIYDNGFRIPDKNGHFSLSDFGYSGGGLQVKTITGPGLAPQTYTFQNLPNNRVLVTQFNYDGDQDLSTEYTFEQAVFSNLNGKLKKIRQFSGILANEGDPRTALANHPLIYQKEVTYHRINNLQKCQPVTRIALQPLDCSRYLVSSTQLTVGEDSFHQAFQSFNQFGQVTQWQEQHTGYRGRVHRYGFDHDLEHWILNQQTTASIGPDSQSQTLVEHFEYYPKNHPLFPFYLKKTYQYGLWQQHYTDYHSHGEVKTVKFNQKLTFGDVDKYRYVRYADYHRGTAQQIYQPASNRDQEVSTQVIFTDRDFGHNQQIIDGNGDITHYGFDHLYRPIYIDPQDSSIADTLISYTPGYVPQQDMTYGTVTRQRCRLTANRKACTDTLQSHTTTHDGKNHLVLSKISDGHDSIYQQSKFNIFGQKVYQGDKTFTAPDLTRTTQGTYTEYDALQRPTVIRHSAGGRITNRYLAGNKIQQTDAKNHVTTTQYLAYGKPLYSQAINIASPEGLTTKIKINTLDQITQITQSGRRHNTYIQQTEYRLYDNYQRLCMIKRTDIGNEYFHYNNLGEIVWTAQGVSGQTCQDHASLNTQKITHHYDNQGQLHRQSFGDGTPDKTYYYDGENNIISINTADYTQTYRYNSVNQVTQEQIRLHKDSVVMGFGYTYDSLGTLASIRYPSNPNPIIFSPNGFGQPTQVTRQVRDNRDIHFIQPGVSYHPTGTIASYTYGNGIVHQTTLTAHQQPKRILDQKPGKDAVLDLGYQYDLNHNITEIFNPKANNSYAIHHLAYDGLDRLISTRGGSVIGNSTITYDSLGNILSYRNTSSERPHHLSYEYDSQFRLTALTGMGSEGYDFQAANRNGGDRYDSYNNRGAVIHNGKRSFEYNLANQMIKSKNNHYLYDGHNRRIKETKQDGSKHYSYYNYAGQLVYSKTKESSTSYFYLGHKLIAKEHINKQPERETAQYFKPFGETIKSPKDDVGYTGHKFDTDLGLSYMQARYYDPVIGRFYSNDPIGALGHSNIAYGFNRYVYANNNPYKYTDPTGEIPLVVVAIWILKEVGGEVFEQATGIPAPTVKNIAKHGMKKAMRQSIKNRKIIEGVYKFKEKNQEYIGQSKDVMKRIKQHASNNKFKKEKAGTLETKEVKGGKLEREKTEQGMIDDATDGQGAGSDKVSNKVNPCIRKECS